MPICVTCKTKFAGLHFQDGHRIEFYKRKRCLTCVPFTGTAHLTRVFESLLCQGCGKSYKNAPGSSTKKLCRSCKVNHRRFGVKARAVKYKGGSCVKCGYKKCSDALTFHHRDPTQKDFQISGSHSRAWAKIKAELDKCELLCNRCHTELHAGLWKL